MTNQTHAQRGARVIRIPPPLYYVCGLVAGVVANSVVALPLGGRPATVVAGALITALGLGLALAGVVAVIGHRTTIVPHRPVATLLTSGAYRLSRNPMYAGLAIAYLGVALLCDSWWPLVLWPLVILAVHHLVIRPEEEYLTERFGQTYADYATRVRRWL